MIERDDYPGGWFGLSWHAPVNDENRHLPTPIGEPCLYCEKIFVDGDRGLTMPHMSEAGASLVSVHLNCFRHEIGALGYEDPRPT